MPVHPTFSWTEIVLAISVLLLLVDWQERRADRRRRQERSEPFGRWLDADTITDPDYYGPVRILAAPADNIRRLTPKAGNIVDATVVEE